MPQLEKKGFGIKKKGPTADSRPGVICRLRPAGGAGLDTHVSFFSSLWGMGVFVVGNNSGFKLIGPLLYIIPNEYLLPLKALISLG